MNIKTKDAGFVGVVFLAIALVGIVIAATSAMSRQSVGGTDQEAIKIKVSIVLKQTSDLKLAFDRMVADGVEPLSITPDESEYYGMYDVTSGPPYPYSVVPVLPSGLRPAWINDPSYSYNSHALLPGIGSNTGEDYVITLPIKDLAVCQLFNKVLHGDGNVAPAVSSSVKTVWAGGGYIDDRANVSLNYAGRLEGCIQVAGATEYVYYKVMYAE